MLFPSSDLYEFVVPYNSKNESKEAIKSNGFCTVGDEHKYFVLFTFVGGEGGGRSFL